MPFVRDEDDVAFVAGIGLTLVGLVIIAGSYRILEVLKWMLSLVH